MYYNGRVPEYTVQLKIMVTDEEREAIRQAAKRDRTSMSAWARKAFQDQLDREKEPRG